jgi:hypothetical protein
MALAYTPGLKIKSSTTVKVQRRLPVLGEVLVKEGDIVSFDTIVARTTIPGEVIVENAASKIGIDPTDGDEIERFMVKKVGDEVEKDEVIAQRIEFFGLSKAFYHSPVKGTVEYFSNLTGSIAIRSEPRSVNVNAYIPGRIAKVLPKEGVIIESQAAYLQGIFGVGGRTHGQLTVVDNSSGVLTADAVGPECAGRILVGGTTVTCDALHKAVKVGARGIIVGGIRIHYLLDFIGRDIGVAITGDEDMGLTLILTEGFGEMKMASRTFELLKALGGKEAAINGATQIRAGVLRPEIIVPLEQTEPAKPVQGTEELYKKGMTAGMRVRIIRDPDFGDLGKIISLPVELQSLETESSVRVLEVELDDGRRIHVPRADVEIIEE